MTTTINWDKNLKSLTDTGLGKGTVNMDDIKNNAPLCIQILDYLDDIHFFYL